MATLNLLIDDGCCGAEFAKLEERGHAAVDKWECPLCGVAWVPQDIGGIVNWRCCETIQIWQ